MEEEIFAIALDKAKSLVADKFPDGTLGHVALLLKSRKSALQRGAPKRGLSRFYGLVVNAGFASESRAPPANPLKLARNRQIGPLKRFR